MLFIRPLTSLPGFSYPRAELRDTKLSFEAGDSQQALPILQQALNYDQNNIGLHLSIGDALRLMGRFDEAKKEFEWVAQRDSSLPQVHYNLGLLYTFAPKVSGMTPKQQVEAAISELEKYGELRRKSDPNDHEELLKRVKLKKAEIDALAAANAPPPPPPPPPPAGTTPAPAPTQ